MAVLVAVVLKTRVNGISEVLVAVSKTVEVKFQRWVILRVANFVISISDVTVFVEMPVEVRL